MRIKIAVLLLSLMFAYSCKKNENQSNSTSEKKVESTTEKIEQKKVETIEQKKVETIEQKKVEQKVEINHAENFDKFLATLDTDSAVSVSKATNYLNENLKDADKNIVDKCFIRLDKFVEEIAQSESEKLQILEFEEQSIVYNLLIGHEDENSKKATQKHKDFVKNLKDNSLKIGAAEGTFFVEKDETSIFKKIENSVSPTMKIFLAQKAKEQKEGSFSDGGLVISPKMLAERVVFWEDFIKKNKGFVMITDEFVFQFQNLTEVVLTGVDNTPVFDYETEKLNDGFKEAFLFLMEKHPNSDVTKLVKPYYEALEKNGFKKSDETEKALKLPAKG